MIIDFGSVFSRKLESKDVEDIYNYRNDPNVYMTLGGFYKGMSREDVQQWVSFQRTNSVDTVWALATKDDDRCIGHLGLYNIDYRVGKAEIGLAISKSHWGNGIGGKIYSGLIEYAFNQLRLHRVETYNLAINKKVIKIKENLGFKLEGVLRDFQYRDGNYLDVMIMTILENEWRALQK